MDQEEAVADIKGYRAQFELAMLTGKAGGNTPDKALVQEALDKFTSLEEQAKQSSNKHELHSITGEAARLCDLRATFFSAAQIPFQGLTVLSTLEQWTLPALALNPLRNELFPKLTVSQSNTIDKAQAALQVLFKEYDEWSDYLDSYNNNMMWLIGGVATFAVVAVTASLWSLYWGNPILGIPLAGLAGSCLSVIAKVPALIVSGDYAPYFRSAVRRLATGVVGSLIGFGFLLSGIVSISFPEGKTLAQIVESIQRATSDSPASIISILEIAAIVMILGTSERVLTTFEEKVLPTTVVPPVDNTPARNP